MRFSVFTVMTPDLTPKQLIEHLVETGYDGVEWRYKETPEEFKQEQPSYWRFNKCTLQPNTTDEELASLRKSTDEKRIEVVSVTPYLDVDDLQATEKVLQTAQKLGASTIRIGVPRYDRTETYQELFKKAVQYVKEVEGMCKQYKVKGLVETHHQTITPSASLAYQLVCHFDPSHIGVLYDPGNMVHEGFENYRMGLELLGDYLAHVHVKNACWQIGQQYPDGSIGWEVQWAQLEHGVVDWKQVLTDLQAVGYDGYVGFEDFSGAFPTKDALSHNINWIKQLLTEIKGKAGD
ncbi:sugar phosphate isomerase/epimerase family protein [Sediminibacillus terrae]|uniref:sugar phosphate isomerase/epimerase family protein n=1 Tax=Sediminibacillus terrae TaxID=1562106 RepID=UPI0012953A04|nr:sugar phosphate isomerase/epimerase family protein [Sediminibacillus terrae]